MSNIYKVIIQNAASEDLRRIWDYIAIRLREPVTAAHLLDRLENAIAALQEFPERHSILQDKLFLGKEIRKFPVDNYIVFYNVNEQAGNVHILRVLHGAQNWSRILWAENN